MQRSRCELVLTSCAVVFLLLGVTNAQNNQRLGDPNELGNYAIGHTGYLVTDSARNRPVYFSVFYPVNADDLTSSTPPALYPTDPYTDPQYYQPTISTDWEQIGYDPAHEGPNPAKGPFPLLVVSPGWGSDAFMYIFIGTRLASHGYVVAILEHWADPAWAWSQPDDLVTAMVNRPRDVSFAITQLLAKSTTAGELIYGSIDAKRIAVSGHSLGGYAAFALAGRDKLVCDTLYPVLAGVESWPYPPETCVSTPPDPRLGAMITLDGSSWGLRYHELQKINVPTLIIGETVDQSEMLGVRDWIARPHAAISQRDSYRVDVNGTNHMSYTGFCDTGEVWFNLGWISGDDLYNWQNSWPCASTGFNPATISSADAHAAITKYMVAFLNVYFGHPNMLDFWVLTPEYALSHTPTVQFIDSEACQAPLPGPDYFSYRPYQVSTECDISQKDSPDFFGTMNGIGNARKGIDQNRLLQPLNKPPKLN